MDYVRLDVDFLRQILAEAFENGWAGFKELQEEMIEKLLNRCLENGKEEVQEIIDAKQRNFNNYVDSVPTNWGSVVWMPSLTSSMPSFTSSSSNYNISFTQGETDGSSENSGL
jgi:hypothetical protein